MDTQSFKWMGLVVTAVVATAVAMSSTQAPPSTVGRDPAAAIARPAAGPGPVPQVAPAPLSAGSETVYVPINPCRIADTRKGGGKLATGAKRNLYVSGTSGFSSQGGTSGGCGIPASAKAATFSITAVSASGSGAVAAWPAGASEPFAKALSFEKGGVHTGTPTVALRPGSSTNLSIRDYSAATHLVVDVTGYYAAQMSAVILEDGVLAHGSRVVQAGRLGIGWYAVKFDTDITHCVATASLRGFKGFVSVSFSGTYAYAYTRNTAGVDSDAAVLLVVTC
jgi:hypothetical protein